MHRLQQGVWEESISWKSINFDWNRARAFLVTAKEGSFTAASKALNVTQSTLSRQVDALEKELDVILFERVGRGLELTPTGLELLEFVEQMSQAASKFSLTATGKSESIEGKISISATEASAYFILPKMVKKLRELEPGITVEIIGTNENSDLRRREADIAIRNVQPKQADLIAKKMPNISVYFYATPEYLREKGNPKTAEDLSRCDFIGFAENTAYFNGLFALGLQVSPSNFPYLTPSHLIHWELTKQGAGIGVMPDFVGDNEPLVQRLPDTIPNFPQIETWLVVHRELRTSHRVRYVFDFLTTELKSFLSEE